MKEILERSNLDTGGMTHRGKVRERNEDQFLVARMEKELHVDAASESLQAKTQYQSGTGYLLVVADGLGGHASGQEASAIVVESVGRYMLHSMPWFLGFSSATDEDILEHMQAVIRRSQESVRDAAKLPPESPGMGTTLTMAYVFASWIYIVHAGDSRCYLDRQGELVQMTRDHTVAQQMVDEGMMRPEDVESSRMSHMLYNAIAGGHEDVLPDVYRSELQPGDTLLLCSDGLNKHVSDVEIAEHLRQGNSATVTCQQLIDAALLAGGTDNVTVVVARLADRAQL